MGFLASRENGNKNVAQIGWEWECSHGNYDMILPHLL